MLQIILLLLPGVLSKEWKVNYPPPICAARGSNVTVNCTFTIKEGQVQQVMWCSMNSNSGSCVKEPYVYDSNNQISNQNNFQYIGDNTSKCSLLINNINRADSGKYKFRIITNSPNDKWTGDPGANISVYDLRVSMSRINRSIRSGDSLNLTCSLDCSGDLAEVQWFKNGEQMKQTNPNLIFNSVTAKDSGNYSCSLRNFTNTLSEEVSIYIEDVDKLSTLLIIVVSSVSLVFIIALFSLILIRRKANEERGGTLESHYATLQITAETQASAVYSNLQEALKE